MLPNEDEEIAPLILTQDTIKECKLVKGALAVISQTLLILLVIITLIYKRYHSVIFYI